MRTAVLAFGSLWAAFGCSRTGLSVDARVDAGPADAGSFDGGIDAGRDASSDAPIDTGADAGCTTQVSSSRTHTCAVSCGDVWCWGQNEFGELGDGTVVSRGSPRRVDGLRARQVEATYGRTCAVLQDGHVMCWGYRDHRGFPGVHTLERRVPELVAGIDRVMTVSVGDGAYALRDDGSVYYWPDYASVEVAPDRIDSLSDIVAIGPSLDGTCTLDALGIVRCRYEGPRWTEMALPGPATALGESCAVVAGVAYCWGFSQSSLTYTRPRAILGTEDVTYASGDEKCGHAMSADHRVWNWGNGPFCRIWNWSDTSEREPAALVEGLLADHVSASCAWTDGVAEIWCWGPGADGALGDGREPYSNRPIPVADVEPGGQLTMSLGHACTAGGSSVECWGTSVLGEVGAPRLGVYVDPQRVPLGAVREVAADILNTCAVTEPGSLWCFGLEIAGEGLLPLTWSPVPQEIPLRDRALSVAMGSGNWCVALADGSVDCWGWRARRGASEWISAPGESVLGPGKAERVVVGLGTVCGIDSVGTLTCVGENRSGDLGLGGPTPISATPPMVVPDVVDASIGPGWGISSLLRSSRRSSCLVRSGGELSCWGYNGLGQIGDGTYDDRAAPTPVTSLGPVQMVDVGSTHTCAIDVAGGAWCWGDNKDGQLGDGSNAESAIPVRVLLDEPAVQISAGYEASCARVASGRVYCWGTDVYSMIGRSDPPPVIERPQRVILAP